MKYFIFIISAYLMGCMAAVPTGPVQLEVARRSINGHLKPALMVVFGAFLADVSYGTIAFFGIAPFLEETKVKVLFWLIGGLILMPLAIVIIRHSLKEQEISYDAGHLKKKRLAFLGGFSLSVINPMMILWWLSGVRIFRDIGLIKEFSPDIAVTFLSAGSIGIASYLVALSLFLFWAKKFISFSKMKYINMMFGVLLLLISLYFIYSSFHNLLA